MVYVHYPTLPCKIQHVTPLTKVHAQLRSPVLFDTTESWTADVTGQLRYSKDTSLGRIHVICLHPDAGIMEVAQWYRRSRQAGGWNELNFCSPESVLHNHSQPHTTSMGRKISTNSGSERSHIVRSTDTLLFIDPTSAATLEIRRMHGSILYVLARPS